MYDDETPRLANRSDAIHETTIFPQIPVVFARFSPHVHFDYAG
jgi:hypothetical protein